MPNISKYFLDEEKTKPLKQYCEEHDYPYRAIIIEIYELLSKNEYSKRKQHEIVNIAIKNVIDRRKISDKYYDYIMTTCKENNLDSDIVFKYIDRYFGKGSNRSVDSMLVSNAVGYAANHKFFLPNGVAVDEVCAENGWVACNVNRRISNAISKFPDKDKKLIAQEIVDTVKQEKSEVYVIDNKPLKEMCEKSGVDHKLVIEEYKKKYGNLETVNEEGLKEAYNAISSKVTRSTPNIIDGLPLPYYCSLYGYPYYDILVYKYGFSIKNKSASNEENIKKAIEYYIFIRDRKIDINNVAIEGLEKTKDPSMVCYYCMILKVSYARVLELKSLHNLTYHQAATLVYFFSDIKDKEGNLSISEKMEDAILNSFKGVEYGSINKSELSMPVAYYLIKCNIFSNSNTELDEELEKVNRNLEKLGVKTTKKYESSKFDRYILLDYQITFIDGVIRSIIGFDHIDVLKLYDYREVVKHLLIDAINKRTIKNRKSIQEYLYNYAKDGFKKYIDSLTNYELSYHPKDNKKEG